VVVKVEGMGQEEAAVVAVAVRGGAGNELPWIFPIYERSLKVTFFRLSPSTKILAHLHFYNTKGEPFWRFSLFCKYVGKMVSVPAYSGRFLPKMLKYHRYFGRMITLGTFHVSQSEVSLNFLPNPFSMMYKMLIY
jgi:hypothetical protein